MAGFEVFFLIIMIYVRYTSVYVHLPCVLYIGNTAKIKYDYKFVFISTFFFSEQKMETSFFKNKFQFNTFSTEYSIILRIYSSKRASPVMKGDFKNKKVIRF